MIVKLVSLFLARNLFVLVYPLRPYLIRIFRTQINVTNPNNSNFIIWEEIENWFDDKEVLLNDKKCNEMKSLIQLNHLKSFNNFYFLDLKFGVKFLVYFSDREAIYSGH